MKKAPLITLGVVFVILLVGSMILPRLVTGATHHAAHLPSAHSLPTSVRP